MYVFHEIDHIFFSALRNGITETPSPPPNFRNGS